MNRNFTAVETDVKKVSVTISIEEMRVNFLLSTDKLWAEKYTNNPEYYIDNFKEVCSVLYNSTPKPDMFRAIFRKGYAKMLLGDAYTIIANQNILREIIILLPKHNRQILISHNNIEICDIF